MISRLQAEIERISLEQASVLKKELQLKEDAYRKEKGQLEERQKEIIVEQVDENCKQMKKDA